MEGKIDSIIQWLFKQDKDKIYEIKEKKEKRSWSQNAYAWKLITERNLFEYAKRLWTISNNKYNFNS